MEKTTIGMHRPHPMLQLSRTILVLASLYALASVAPGQTFTVIGLPDTQHYSASFPHVYHQQTQWVANARHSLDIRYVSHYGDLVCDSNSMSEWAVADAAMATIEATGVAHGVTPGNHDITPSGIYGSAYLPQNYLNFFGPQRYTGRPWHGGASPTGMSSWQTFQGGGQSFLTMHLECDTPLHELQWAQGVLDNNRDKIVLLTTHRYLQDAASYTSGVPLVPSGRYPNEWYQMEGTYAEGGIKSEELFDWFIRRNPNILMVQCGHFHEEYRQTSTNVYGKPVHEVLADYQDLPNGGDGWLRVMGEYTWQRLHSQNVLREAAGVRRGRGAGRVRRGGARAAARRSRRACAARRWARSMHTDPCPG